MNSRANSALQAWHRLVRKHDASGLKELLAEEVVFHSPVVQTPQRGKQLACLYRAAAFDVEIDGLIVNGVDMIAWNDEGKIIDFKVMIRPLKAINLIHQKMARLLQEKTAMIRSPTTE